MFKLEYEIVKTVVKDVNCSPYSNQLKNIEKWNQNKYLLRIFHVWSNKLFINKIYS